jgi:hypothetical protein
MAGNDSAMVLVELLRWGTELGIEDAANSVFSDDFQPESAPASDPAVTKLLTFAEGVATLCKHGMLERDLVIDMWAMELIWKRVGPAALRMREQLKEPRLYENFEALAKG